MPAKFIDIFIIQIRNSKYKYLSNITLIFPLVISYYCHLVWFLNLLLWFHYSWVYYKNLWR